MAHVVSSSLYNFKVVDFRTVHNGYLFKLVSTDNRPTKYELVYVPVARFPSILMLDFLLSSNKKLADDLGNYLMDMVKKELDTYDSNTIIGLKNQYSTSYSEIVSAVNKPTDSYLSESLGAINSQTKQTVLNSLITGNTKQGHLSILTDGMEGIRFNVRKAVIDKIMASGIRVSNDKKLHVARNASFTRKFLNNMDKIDSKSLALRIHQGQLVVDYVGDGGDRITNVHGMVSSTMRNPGSRVDVWGAVFNKDGQYAYRSHIFGGYTDYLSKGYREDVFEGVSLHDFLNSDRANKFNLYKYINSILSNRQSTEFKINLSNYLVDSQRGVNRELVISGNIELERFQRKLHLDIVNPTLRGTLNHKNLYVVDNQIEAKLKARQYPTLLHKSLWVERDNDINPLTLEESLLVRKILDDHKLALNDVIQVKRIIDSEHLFIDRSSPIKSERIIDGQNMLLDYLGDSIRDIGGNRLFKDSSIVRSSRVTDNHSLFILNNVSGHRVMDDSDFQLLKSDVDGGLGSRDVTNNMLLVSSTSQSYREINQQLDVVEFVKGNRDKEVSTLIEESFKVERYSEFYFHMLKDLKELSRVDKLLSLDDTVNSSKDIQRSVYLPPDLRSVKNSKNLNVDTLHDPFSAVNKSLFIEDQVYKALRGEESNLKILEDLTLVVRESNNKNLDLLSLWKAIRIKHRFLHYKDSGFKLYANGGIIKSRIFDSILMEEMLIGYLMGSDSWILEEIFTSSKETTIKALFDEPGYLTGVLDRIEALVDSGILAGKDSQFDSLLTFIEYGELEDRKATISEHLIDSEVYKNTATLDQGDYYGSVKHQNAVINQSIESNLEKRAVHVDQNDLQGNIVLRPIVIEVENPLGYFEADPSEFMADSTEAKKPDRIAVTDSVLTSYIEKPSFTEDFIIAFVDPRESNLDERTFLGEVPLRKSVVGYGYTAEGIYDKAQMMDNQFISLLDTYGAIYGESFIAERDSHSGVISDHNLLGLTDETKSALHDSMISMESLDGWGIYTDLVTGSSDNRKSTIQDYQSTGIQPLKLVESPEEIMASFHEKVSFLATGFVFAKDEEQRAQFLDHLQALLPERVSNLEQYVLAKNSPDPSMISNDNLFSVQAPMDSVVFESDEGVLKPLDTEIVDSILAQGLMYTHDNDLIDSSNVEDWTVGFGIPDDYNPHDPFNSYHPYSSDLNTYELAKYYDWKKIGSGATERDDYSGKLVVKDNVDDLTGYLKDDFSHKEYKFSVDFKVDDVEGDWVGVIFKYFDDNNYYRFMVNGGGSYNNPMVLYRIRDGLERQIGTPMAPYSWKLGNWHTIEVTVLKDRFTIHVDKILQYEIVE